MTSELNPAHTFSRADVIRWFGAGEVRKGSSYLRDVSRLNVAPRRISAEVLGTAPRAYRVEVNFSADRQGHWRVESTCTCPVGTDCKHAAATLLVALDRRGSAPQASPLVLSWAERLREQAGSGPARIRREKKPSQALVYVISFSPYRKRWQVGFIKAGIRSDGVPNGRGEHWANVERALVQPPSFIGDEDQAILRLLWAQRGPNRENFDLPLAGRHSGEILRRIADTGRVRIEHADGMLIALAPAGPRRAHLSWHADEAGITPQFVADGATTDGTISLVLPSEPPWYVDLVDRRFGPLETGLATGVVPALLELPPLSDQDIPIVADTLAEFAPGAPLPTRDHVRHLRLIDCDPVPILVVASYEVFAISPHREYPSHYGRAPYEYAQAFFRYDDAQVGAGSGRELVTLADGETVRVLRRPEVEKARLQELKASGFADVPAHALHSTGHTRPSPMLGLASEADWEDFCRERLATLRERGWEVTLPAGFRHHIREVGGWYADFRESTAGQSSPQRSAVDDPDFDDESGLAGGWFEVDLGIDVDGRRLPLAPLLHELFRRDPRWLSPEGLRQIADAEGINLDGPDGTRIRIRAERLKPLAKTLIDLFDRPPDGLLRLPKLDAARLVEATTGEHWQTTGEETARAIAERLLGCQSPTAMDEPADFGGVLRPYQREGLGWLQYLRRHDLAGILADDMGLGKTAQALAHLLVEKAEGRLAANGNGPALIVLPTSLIFNWKREAAHFAPGLRVLSLHGPDRKTRFGAIPSHDVVLTTYPLLWRDEEELAKHAYHLLILDEAQTVKNAASRAADIVRGIKARHRLCITGTPLENHLGELWSQFDFLLPGLLGDTRSFARLWRTPIEKHGDLGRRDLLARRVRPFMLRRRKEDVATELPPKTIIVRSVELDGGQRDLYETVRSTMDRRVRDEIASRGFARSHIIILDALLKLRQVCCDPRLLKIDAARRVKERAKLDLLMDMLPELVDEGRRVLVFSQFTSMLALIEAELNRIKLPYVLLTGDTTDRETPIRRFQDGEVPIFLISLKAGGVGLNLTAADTVIHYDPWWNPAVENQATDRAHRIGQTRKVFVYKLVVAGSIEEKIIALQESKAELAAGVLSEDSAGIVKFGESELTALLEPLAPLAGKE